MKFYDVVPFTLRMTPRAVMVAVRPLGAAGDLEAAEER
jgi:hypothetical protein